MDHIFLNDNLQVLNRKLIEENQLLSLQVYSLQRQLQNASDQITQIQKLEAQISLLQEDIHKLKRDNMTLIEQVIQNTPEKELQNLKEIYEQKLYLLTKENKRLIRINKDLYSKQANNIESLAAQLLESSVNLRNKLVNLESFQQQNPSITSPKEISKHIYEDLIQQLQSTETKTFRVTQKKNFPNLTKETKYNQTLGNINISLASNQYK